MSDLQRGIFFLDRASSDLRAYNVAQAFRLVGELDVPALRAALDDVVARHDVLRARFVDPSSGGVHILPVAPADFAIVDPVLDTEAFVHAEVTQRLDLGSGRLLRARLGVAAPREHVLVLVTHHIVSDAVSKGVLAEELSALYNAHHEGRPSPLAEPSLHYFDYAAWQVASAALDEDLEWWCSELDQVPVETEMPVDRPRTGASWDGAKHTQRLDAGLATQVAGFARSNRATLFMVLLAALAGLLERYSGQGDVVIGSPTTGRHRRELENVVGLFLNTLPLRVRTAGDPTFRELVARAKGAATAAYRHQDVPFERIVERLRPPRAPGRNPFFQAALTVKHGGSAVLRLDGVDVRPVPYEGGWTKFDLMLVAQPSADALLMLWQYSTALFDAATVERLAGQLEELLRSGIENPDVPLQALPLAGAADLAAIEKWNATTVAYPVGTVHSRIEAQVRRTPNAPAVGDSTGWISYGELDRRANRLARHLVDLGVHPDARVAICLERSIDLEVAVLAVLKAGGAYVPLDPEYPTERLRFMLDDCRATALITAGALQASVPAHPCTVLMDRPESFAHLPGTPPRTSVTADDLAYVLYTSGTTGRPKGVQVEHRSVTNQLEWMQRTFRLDSTDTVLQKTPFSFDVAGWEILWAPMTGARLFMARPGGQRDPGYLARTVEELDVTVLNFVPSMLSIFLATEGASRCRSVRLVLAAGEALPDEVKDTCLTLLPDAELYNLYGPTEATIAVTGESCARGVPVTIGRPVANTRVLVVDSAGHPQPIGMPGELWLAGAQIARGYLGRDELTSERFLRIGSEDVYRTGDLASWTPDGRVRFLGRRDDQVKLRGFRIELGEIEAVLATHPAVAQAAVTVTAGGSGDPVLAAYVVLRAGATPTTATSELAATARERLPHHMLPSAVTVLDALPLTPAGKLDRRALAERGLPAPSDREHVPPRTATEARLATLWQEALGLDRRPSVTDDFFELGGTSLIALSLFAAVEREFRVTLSMSMLFDSLSVAAHAAAVDRERNHRSAPRSVVVLRDGGTRRPLFLFPTLHGDVLLFRETVAALDGDRPVYGIEGVGTDGRSDPLPTIEAIAAHGVRGIRAVQPEGPYLLAGFCFGGVVAYEAAVQLTEAGQQVSFVGLIDSTPYGRGRGYSPAEVRRRALGRRLTIKSRQDLSRQLAWATHRTRGRARVIVAAGFRALRLPPPPALVDVFATNLRARRAYITRDSPLRVSLFRISTASTSSNDVVLRRWQEVAKGGADMCVVPGDGLPHQQILTGERATRLAEAMKGYLAELT